MIVLSVSSSQISLNLSAKLSQYQAASELYPWISSQKWATKFVDCIMSATGSTKYCSLLFSLSCNIFRQKSLNHTPSHPHIYLSFILSTSNIFSKFSVLITTILVLIFNQYSCAI